ncbi:MAG: zinc ribbon domain-containing protein [Alphaproteobacteria bacterium]|nr:zinc ribbon domain-containing protein [Alphaproteobacteria bacterium]
MKTCPNCQASAPENRSICNSCGHQFVQGGGAGFCGNCGSPLQAKYAPCPKCGHVKTTFQNPGVGGPGIPASMIYKSEGTTLVLSIVLGLLGVQGVGHLYVGRIGRGVGILVGAIVLLISGFLFPVMFIAYFVVFVLQIIDARKLCLQYNQHIAATGQRPW